MLGQLFKVLQSRIMMRIIYQKKWVGLSCFISKLISKIFVAIEMKAEYCANSFYNGELELELHRIKKIHYCFKKDSDREICMRMIEKYRRENLYPHPDSDCTTDCRARGELVTIYSYNYSSLTQLIKICSQFQDVENCGLLMVFGSCHSHTACTKCKYVTMQHVLL